MHLLEELQASHAPRIPKERDCQELIIPEADLKLFKAPYDGIGGGLGITDDTLPDFLNEALQTDGPGSDEWNALKVLDPESFVPIKALYYYLASDL